MKISTGIPFCGINTKENGVIRFAELLHITT